MLRRGTSILASGETPSGYAYPRAKKDTMSDVKAEGARRGRPPKRSNIPIRLRKDVPVTELVKGFFGAGPHPGDPEKVRKAKKTRAKRVP